MTDGPRILVCDDEPGIRKTLSQILGDEGYTVDAVGLGQEALERAFGDEGQRPEAIFLDVWLPDLDGLAVLDRLRAAGLAMPIVMISGHGTVDTAVQAVKRGADDFLEKPLSLERVLLTLDKALERYRLARERDDLRRELMSRTDEDAAKETLLGTSPAMMRLLDEIRRAGASEARVLIMGESGVGKELVARALHRASPRSAGPFIEVNGAAIPEELIESELFGHVKGSFTGAIDDRKGKWEQADSGTLFLDEIGDMSPRTQAKILRAIQDGRITRVGGARTLATDVRIVAATNRDLPAMIRAGTFREDLYFRLAVVPLHVAPLSERPEDIPSSWRTSPRVSRAGAGGARRRSKRRRSRPSRRGDGRAMCASCRTSSNASSSCRRGRPSGPWISRPRTARPPGAARPAGPRTRFWRTRRSPRRARRSRSATSRVSSRKRRGTCRARPSASASTAPRSIAR